MITPVVQLRVCYQVFTALYYTCRHLCCLQSPHYLLRCIFDCPFLHERIQLVFIFLSAHEGGEPGVFRPHWIADDVAEVTPFFVGAYSYGAPALAFPLTAVDAVRCGVGRPIA